MDEPEEVMVVMTRRLESTVRPMRSGGQCTQRTAQERAAGPGRGRMRTSKRGERPTQHAFFASFSPWIGGSVGVRRAWAVVLMFGTCMYWMLDACFWPGWRRGRPLRSNLVTRGRALFRPFLYRVRVDQRNKIWSEVEWAKVKQRASKSKHKYPAEMENACCLARRFKKKQREYEMRIQSRYRNLPRRQKGCTSSLICSRPGGAGAGAGAGAGRYG